MRAEAPPRVPRILGRIARPLGYREVRRNVAFTRTMHRVQGLVHKMLWSQSPDSLRLARTYVRLTGEIFGMRPRTLAGLVAGRNSWLEAEDGRAFTAVLALVQELEKQGYHALAAELAELVVDIRPASRACWRVLAAAYHELGEEAMSARARSRGHIGTEPVTRHRRVGVVLDEIRKDVVVPGGEPATALAAAFDAVLREHRPADELLVAGACALHPAVKQKDAEAVAGVVLRCAVAGGGAVAPWVHDLGRAWSAARVPTDATLSAEAAAAVRTIDLGGLRQYLDGRSVCLVANSQRVAESGAGRRIDAYDVVVRFNSFALDPANTGRRTDIHATIHMHDYNWSVPVDVRVVFSGKGPAWRQSIVKHLVADAQKYLGDATLRWPVRDPALLGDTVVDVPTSGFNMLRLVDFLDVSPVIDLVGFDFNATGAYRLPEAMELPVARAHDYDGERTWVMSRATNVDDLVISLR
jgi:hypothetical protein